MVNEKSNEHIDIPEKNPDFTERLLQKFGGGSFWTLTGMILGGIGLLASITQLILSEKAVLYIFEIWKYLLPIITLILGYIFGKSKK